MPKNPLKFGRRKSSGNVIEEVSPAPAVSSFRVLERPEKINLNGADARQRGSVPPVTRPFNSPLVKRIGRSAEELGVGLNRGSGGTTNSGSSGYYDSSSASARHSSSSTLPSSVDAEKELEDEELFPRKTKSTPMYSSAVSVNDIKPTPPRPSFTSRAARAISFGQKHDRAVPAVNDAPPPPPLPFKSVTRSPERIQSPERSASPKRERAMTTSSYASTAKPEVNLNLSTSDFGSEFGSMFDRPKSGERFAGPLPPVPPVAAFHRTESEPMFPPRTHARSPFRSSPDPSARDDASSPYGWDRRGSSEMLMSNSPIGSPAIDGPPVPPHRTSMAPAFLGNSKGAYSLVPERRSPALDQSPQDERHGFLAESSSDQDEGYNPWDEDKSAKRAGLFDKSPSNNASTPTFSSVQTRVPSGYPAQARAGASRLEARSPSVSEEEGSMFSPDSLNVTPRAARVAAAQQDDDSLFDSSPSGPPSRAIRPQHSRGESNTPRKMTKAQFDRIQRRGSSSVDRSEEEEEQRELDEYDAGDDSEQAKRMARQRQKQEANMSLYRQQMKKVTGGGPTDLPSMARPSLDRAAASAPAANGGAGSLHFGGIGGKPPADAARGKQSDEDDEDVPLGILQAHGFPSSSRPPTRSGDNDASHQRRTSASGSVVGGGAGQGNLPPFARRLPADPYFGSSLVNSANRESLGMASSASVYGGPSAPTHSAGASMGHPGGLVGVIAGEERAKASRRGSPNMATGTYGPQQVPLPQNMPGMPPRSMSMGSMMPPQVYSPSVGAPNPMMGMPMMPQMPMMQNMQGDQMQQFMQMQMQVMQNMLAMQQQQMVQTPPPMTPQQQQAADYLGVQVPGKRMSMASTASKAPSVRTQATNQGRAMTMMNPPTRWDLPQAGQRPNSAMPNTYAPSGLGVANGLPAGYSASIAPSERSTIGMPSRYRPVTMGNDGSGRSQTMTSQSTLQAYGNRTPTLETPRPQSVHQTKSTIRAVDKPKGAPRSASRAAVIDEDEEDGWAEMKKKREDKKRFRFGKKKDTSLEELVQGLN